MFNISNLVRRVERRCTGIRMRLSWMMERTGGSKVGKLESNQFAFLTRSLAIHRNEAKGWTLTPDCGSFFSAPPLLGGNASCGAVVCVAFFSQRQIGPAIKVGSRVHIPFLFDFYVSFSPFLTTLLVTVLPRGIFLLIICGWC